MRPRAVLDASAALRAVLGLEQAEAVLDFLEDTTQVLAPSVFVSEVTNGLWKYVQHGDLTRHRATQLLDRALLLSDAILDDRELAREALMLASEHGHPVYDALYAVLARRNGCPLATFDRRLIGLLQEIGVEAFSPTNAAKT